MKSEHDIDDAYEERADYLSTEALEDAHVDSEIFKRVEASILGRGAKLIVGPRGSGKTHQLRRAHSICRNDQTKPLSAYTSFGRYLRLEPRLVNSPDALRVFHTWVLAKVQLSLHESLTAQGHKSHPTIEPETLETFVANVEMGIDHPNQEFLVQSVTIDQTLVYIDECQRLARRKRTILLMDDAALTLTPEFMIEFFDVFRNLKTSTVSPKASVYPGTTQYGPRFHVGQDAEEVLCWFDVSVSEYLPFMEGILQQRLRPQLPEHYGALFAFAAFGIPRNLITLVRSFEKSRKRTSQAKFKDVLEQRSSQIQAEFESLATKMPQFKTLLERGWLFFMNAVRELVNQNLKDKTGETTLLIGIERVGGGHDALVVRMISLMREVGLLYDNGPVHHGSEPNGAGRVYDRYTPHLLFLIQARAFDDGSRGFNASKALVKIADAPRSKHPLRRKVDALIGDGGRKNLQLDSPNCSNCNAGRLSDDQIYCHKCGTRLLRLSAYQECMKIRLESCGLSAHQIKELLTKTELRTIGDVVQHNAPATEIRKARYVGPKRTRSILDRIALFVDEFLER